MTSTRVYRLLAALLFIVAVGGCGGSGDKTSSNNEGIIDWPQKADVETGPQVGQRAPNFRLVTPDGATVELASYAGKPVLLNFFASWCANCKEEMAALEVASTGGANVVGINFQESAAKVTELATETGATFPLLLDPNTDVSRKGYKVTALPVTVLIDGEGIIREIIRGPVDTPKIDELLATVASVPAEGSTT